jgi:hypothetical protein
MNNKMSIALIALSGTLAAVKVQIPLDKTYLPWYSIHGLKQVKVLEFETNRSEIEAAIQVARYLPGTAKREDLIWDPSVPLNAAGTASLTLAGLITLRALYMGVSGLSAHSSEVREKAKQEAMRTIFYAAVFGGIGLLLRAQAAGK